MTLHLTLLLLIAAVGSNRALPSTQSGNSQAALDTEPNHNEATPPAELAPLSAENLRFSRLLKNTANVLQFSSISNDAPPIWGIRRDGKKEVKVEKVSKGNSISLSNFGRRALDYDEPNQGFEEPTSESKIVAHPYPGNEYVYVRAGKLDQQVEAATNPHHRQLDSDASASVTTINNKPPRVPLAILRQKKGKRVNITPLFTELPPQANQDASDNAAAKEFVWVDQPSGEQLQHRVIAVNRRGRKHEEVEVTTTASVKDEDGGEATTVLPDDLSFESSTSRQQNSKLIVNVVTSEPRYSVQSSSSEKKSRYNSRRTKATTAATTTTTAESTTTSATTTTAQTTTEAVPETTTVITTTTSQAPSTTTVAIPVLSSSSPRALVVDEKENLVADASHRAGSSFHGSFQDSQAKLQASESSQPARVNVRPAQNGKEYEYEYIYYYYDDEDENGEKSGEHPTKAVESSKDVKNTSPAASTTLASSTPGSSSRASSQKGTQTLVTSSITTSTSTLPPTSEADFEYEDDASEEEVNVRHQVPEIVKSAPVLTRTTEAPIHKGVSSAEKLSNSNPINQLDRSRGPKITPGKFEEAVAEYKLETEASQEDAVQTHAHAKGQPVRHHQASTTSFYDDETADAPPPGFHVNVREPSTLSPASPSTIAELDIPDHMSTLAKHHKDSVNVPIVLKQSSLLKAVPVSHLGHQTQHHSQVTTFATPSTTTTTVEITSEAVPSRLPSSRLRGHNRLRANASPRPAVTSEQPATTAEDKPQQTVRRPHHRDSSRRIPARRPAAESSTVENVPEQQPVASPIIENHARPLPIRPRFPPRTGAGHSTTTVTSYADETVSDSPPQPVVTVSAAELNSLDDKKAKDSHIRAKSANDLFAFARLQQAISSRAPSRIQPKLVAGFVNSGEVTTEAITSSEVTTVTSFGGQSSETVSSDDAPSTTTTTTTTTTEAVQLDKYGRQRTRFGGRTRRPLGGAGGSSASSTTTEAPATQRNRFNGRRRTSTTEAPEGAVQQSASSNNEESPKPKLPQRNRFATRHRGFSTTEATPSNADGLKPAEADKPASAPVPRRRPGPGGFQGRRRPNQIQSQTEASSAATQQDTPSVATDAGSTTAASSTAAPALPGRNRFNFNAAGGRQRPGAQQAGPGANPLRIRGGGRLRTSTSTTTEAIPEEHVEIHEQPDAEQSPTIQNENIDQSLQSSPAPEAPAPAQRGVLGRLKNRPKLVVTTTLPPEGGSGDRKHRLNGLLARRKNLGQLASAVHIKEEVKETTSEGEEANNHALEQIDEDHKGVVVQVSSSVTESEEVNEAHAGEVLEPSSTTPGSILNRLKSQRKPGSIFRKKPDPHGE